MCVFHRDDNKQLSVDGISLGAIANNMGHPFMSIRQPVSSKRLLAFKTP